MTLKSDAKFKEKLTQGFKYDMRNDDDDDDDDDDELFLWYG